MTDTDDYDDEFTVAPTAKGLAMIAKMFGPPFEDGEGFRRMRDALLGDEDEPE